MLPSSLQTLSSGDCFDQSLHGVTLPSILQSLTCGFRFNQSLHSVTLPRCLQTLTFGHCFHQGLDGVTLPSSLQTLTFGCQFAKLGRCHAAAQPANKLPLASDSTTACTVSRSRAARRVTWGYGFNRDIDLRLPVRPELGRCRAAVQPQTLTFGFRFNQSLPVSRSVAARRLTLGYVFNRSLQGVTRSTTVTTRLLDLALHYLD
jgi:hypothetical protein